ncbi:MAG TPA: hypothetical protein VGQ49_11295 [Bryobacteraceae bacterium]|nr:hypothetical protein [Bryobacteraceae bacterium]
MPMQLPEDAVFKGWKETDPGYYEKVYFSPSRNFTGTEWDFYDNCHAYFYDERPNGWRSLYFKRPTGS